MKTFHHPVCLGMVSSGCDTLDAPSGHQLGPDGGAELGAPVGGNCSWNPKRGDPSVGESVCDRFRRHVWNWNRLWPSREPVNDGKKVFVAV